MGKVSRVENREKTKTDGTSTWLPQFRNQQKKLFCCFSDWDSRVCLWLLAYCRADRSCLCLQKKHLMSLPRPNLSTQLDFLPPPRASGQPARLPPAEKLLPCSLWSESASECTRDPRRRKTWAQQVCIPSVSTCNLCFRHGQPVLFLVRLRPRNPHDGDYHHPRSRHHIWILLQEVLIDTAPNKT